MLKAAVQRPPAAAGIPLADWNWKVVRRFVQERFGITLVRSSCLNYLHRLGFVVKRPKKRLLKADATKRAAFVEDYAAVRAEAQVTGAVEHLRAHPEAHGVTYTFTASCRRMSATPSSRRARGSRCVISPSTFTRPAARWANASRSSAGEDE